MCTSVGAAVTIRCLSSSGIVHLASKTKLTLLPQEAFNSSSAWDEASTALPPLRPHADWLDLAQVLSRKHHFALVFRDFCLMLPSLAVVPSPVETGGDTDIPLVDDHSTDILYA